MPKYAEYDIYTGPPYPVVGWYDTDVFTYGYLPENILQITDQQWQARMDNAWWAIEADLQTLIETTVPIISPNLTQQAVIAVYSGLLISLNGSLTMSPTLFPTDQDTQNKIAAVITTVNATGTFPGGVYYYPMKDSSGAWHSFTTNQYAIVATAISSYASSLHLIADGNPFGATALPSNAVNLTV